MTGLWPVLAAASPSASPSVSATPVVSATPIPSAVIPTAVPTVAPLTSTLSNPQLPALLLSGIVWIPLIAAAILLVLPTRTPAQRARVRTGAIVGSGFVFVLALLMWYGFADQGGTVAYEELRPWLPQAASSYHLGLDGVSMALVLLSSLLPFIVILASSRVRERTSAYYALILLFETGANGVFCSLDYLLMLLFWAIPSVAIFLLCAGWGSEQRRRAAWKALAFGLASTGLFALGAMLVAVNRLTFDVVTLHGTVLRANGNWLAFTLFFSAFAILLPVIPVHTWFTDVVGEATAPVAALVAGVFPALGGYGFYRTIVGEFPVELHRVRGAVLVLTLVTLVWSGLSALGQDDLKRAIAQLTISRSSLVLLAVVSAQPVALNGGLMLLFATGLGAALVLLTAGLVEERAGTRSIRALSGLAARLPRAAILYLVGGLAVVGMPGLAGFSAILLVFIGAYPVERTSTTIAIVGSLLLIALVVSSAERVFFGSIGDAFARVRDLTTLELTYAVILAGLIVALGIFPGLLINNINFGILTLLTPGTG